MNLPCFVDSNVLIYARDTSEPAKQAKAQAWKAALWPTRQARISFQVLHEYYVTVTQKLRPGMDREEARREIHELMLWDPLVLDHVVMERAWSVQDRFRLSWWDSLIVAAAQHCGCGILLTEDLQDGAKLDGLTVVNPFKHDPRSVWGLGS